MRHHDPSSTFQDLNNSSLLLSGFLCTSIFNPVSVRRVKVNGFSFFPYKTAHNYSQSIYQKLVDCTMVAFKEFNKYPIFFDDDEIFEQCCFFLRGSSISLQPMLHKKQNSNIGTISSKWLPFFTVSQKLCEKKLHEMLECIVGKNLKIVILHNGNKCASRYVAHCVHRES